MKEQKIIAGTASAKFESLKNQIDPHFLFNSLNVLSPLIEENPENAQKFETSLSKIYRYVLEQELDPEAFYRISRKFIIPLKSIKEIVVYSNSRLKVILPSYKDDEVIVSREKVSDFRAWIG